MKTPLVLRSGAEQKPKNKPARLRLFAAERHERGQTAQTGKGRRGRFRNRHNNCRRDISITAAGKSCSSGTIAGSNRDLLVGKTGNSGALLRVFNRQRADISGIVQVEQRVLVEVSRLGNYAGTQFNEQRVRLCKIFNFHNSNDLQRISKRRSPPSSCRTIIGNNGSSHVRNE